MYGISLDNNSIPHAWRLADIIPVPKPGVDVGALCRPISLLSVMAGTLEKTLLPCIKGNITHLSTRHGFRGGNSAGATLKGMDGTIVTGFGQGRAHNRSGTGRERSVRHGQHAHTPSWAAPDKHPIHHCQMHRKLHQRPQGILHIQKQNINTTPIQKWCSTGRHAISHTLQHVHAWHSNTTGTSEDDGLRGRHQYGINTRRHRHS